MAPSIRRLLPSLFLLAAFAASAGSAPSMRVHDGLRQRADAFFAGTEAGGVVLVRKDGDTLLRHAYGLADVENRVPMRPEMVFRLASTTKQFTAVVVLQLVEAGTLQLDQTLASIDPALPAPIGDVTLHQLLTHTSGIRNISSIPASRAARRNETTAQELLPFFKDLPLDFAPGSRFSYSNSNYILLTRVIELVSGQPYAEYMDRAIFTPLGMSSTRYGSHTAIIRDRAHGYRRDDAGRLENADFISMTQPQGAGGLVSTVDDLAKWEAALQAGTLVDQGLLEHAFRKVRLDDDSEQPYGYGWIIGQVQDTPSLEHGGFINGFNAYLLRVPAQGLFVAVLTNAEFLGPDDFAAELAAIALGRPYDRTAAADPEGDRWLGRYDFAHGVQRDIVRTGTTLYSQRVGSGPIPLLPARDGRYYIGDGLDHLTFAVDDEGRATMTLHNRLMGASTGVRGSSPAGTPARSSTAP